MPAITYYAQSLTELLAKRARDQPDDPFVYTGTPETRLLESLTFFQTQKAVDRLAWHYSGLDLLPETIPGSTPPTRVIAVLTSSAIDEVLLQLALGKLGLASLLLSVNNSVPAVVNLSKITNATHLIYGAKYTQEAQEAQALLQEQGYIISLIEDKRFPLWGPEGAEATLVKPFPALLTPEQEKDRLAVILHSSGSTGFPKPIYMEHYRVITNVSGEREGKPGFSTLPVYHAYGHGTTFSSLYGGQSITLYPPHLPLTSANICKVIAASPGVGNLFAVPYVIKLLGETSEGIKALSSFKAVISAGAALPDDLGNRLVAAGVNILNVYGSTETGFLMSSSRDFATDKGWNWLRPSSSSVNYIVMESRGDNIYEIVVKDGYPPKIETNRPDGSYATKDIFLRHQMNHNWYKYMGRVDDTIVQVLGEKTNPVPMELCIRGNSPYIAEAIVFGANRPQTGCLILPSDLGKDLSRDQLMENIWPVIEQANSEAPTHSRLFPDMIEFLPYGTEIPVASKLSILRPVCYTKFKSIIDAVYDRFGREAEVEKITLPRNELEDFIINTIAKTSGTSKVEKLDKSTDLFAFGVDSLQATRIRNTLQRSLELGGKVLGQHVVYENPSVEKLAAHILAMQSGDDTNKSDKQQQNAMIDMLDKWASRLESRQQSPNTSILDDGHVVVLTGATGSLGAHILSKLVASPAVRKIICLCRASSHGNAHERVRKSLQLRKITIDSGDKVEAYASDPNAGLLGLTKKEYEQIRNEATIVIHNAWPVNFILNIESFDEHVGGALNLINLCLQSPRARPAEFYFSSSVSSSIGTPDATCAEDFPPSPSTAARMGYGRSKWVVEKLCQRAAERTDVKIGVLRIGQMVGDSVHGVWNETEAWPLMFKGANIIGALPRLDEHPSWLPVDYAGDAITEIVLRQDPPKSMVYHIVNPNISASWDDILAGLKDAGLEFETVERSEWLDRLAASDKDPERNPLIKLFPFFRDVFSTSGRVPMNFLTIETAKVSSSISSSPFVSLDLVRKWVEHWREVRFLV